MSLLVCFSHLRWNFVWQRPQHLLTRAAQDHDVLFIEEPVRRDERPRLEITEASKGLHVVVPVVPVNCSHEEGVGIQKRLIQRLLASPRARSRILWYYTPMALEFSRDLDGDVCVYDNMDELTLFRGAGQALLDFETGLLARADVVFTGGQSLYEAKRDRHTNIHCFPSSIDFKHFAEARGAIAEPADQAAIPHPRVGFFGVIDERMDLELVRRSAELRPEWQFVMIGPVVKIDPGELPKANNIHWLGQKDYQQLPAYLSGWDVGFMPFALNESTRFISPTKTPEFLAAGLPVVSTPIQDVVRPYGDKHLVEIAATPSETIERMEAVLERPQLAWLRRVDRHLARTSWDKTWAGMDRIIQASLGGSTETAREQARQPSAGLME